VEPPAVDVRSVDAAAKVGAFAGGSLLDLGGGIGEGFEAAGDRNKNEEIACVRIHFGATREAGRRGM